MTRSVPFALLFYLLGVKRGGSIDDTKIIRFFKPESQNFLDQGLAKPYS